MAGLKKVLNFPTILLITINSIMGTGIFFLPAVGARYSGPASIISWIMLSIFSIYIAMCFAELTSMFPKAGGVYEFCKQAYGRFPSFLVGWTTFVAGNITIAMLVVGAITYLLPDLTGVVPILGFKVSVGVIKIGLCLLFILLFNYIAYKGMKTSAVMLVTFAFITIGTLLALIIPGFFRIQTSNLTPFVPLGISSVFITVFFIAETFFGWETATFLAGETKDGAKVMPKALIIATIVIAAISLLSVITSIGVINWKEFGVSAAPLSNLALRHFGPKAGDIFTLLVYLAIIGSVAGWIVSAPRLVLSMAEDKLFPTHFAAIHPKNHTPYKAIIFQTILISILVFVAAGAYETLLHLLLPMLLVLYSTVLLSVVILRIKKPDIKRYYTVPFGKVGPIIIVLILFAMIYGWFVTSADAMHTLKLGGSFILFGLPVYALIEMYYNPRSIRLVQDTLAYFTLLTERIALPPKIRKEVIALLGDVKGKTVLEFGCSVGTLTMHLAEEVGKNGKIYATDTSKKEIEITQKRLDKKGHKHVKVLHDEHHHRRVHPSIPKIHTVVSVGMLGYVQDMNAVLKDTNRRLKKGAKICFVDYDRFFDIIPNVEWLGDDKKIKKIFRDAGFTVGIVRKQGFAWKYVFIYGTKFKNV